MKSFLPSVAKSQDNFCTEANETNPECFDSVHPTGHCPKQKRFRFDYKKTGKCVDFVYYENGCDKERLNNFGTIDACKVRCETRFGGESGLEL